MIKYIAQALAFGLVQLVRVARPETVAADDHVHAHWDRAGRRWVVRGEELDRAA